MMKIISKMAILGLLAALLFMPLQAAQAKSPEAGPIFGSNFTLKSGETLNEDLIVIGGSVSIEKDALVNGTVVLFGGSFTLDGDVMKDVVVMGGAVKLGAGAHIRGNLVAYGAPVNRDAGARVDGETINNPTRPGTPDNPLTPMAPVVTTRYENPIWNAFVILGQSIVLALLAMLIAMFLPVQLRRVADGVVTQPLIAFGMGLLTTIGFIVAIVALGLFSVFIITLLVTVPLIIVISVAFAAASLLGWLALGMEVGVRISQMFKGEWPLPLAAGLGVFILNLMAQGIGFIPCVGGLIASLIGLAGLGAVFMTRFGTRISTLAAPIVPAAPAAPAPES